VQKRARSPSRSGMTAWYAGCAAVPTGEAPERRRDLLSTSPLGGFAKRRTVKFFTHAVPLRRAALALLSGRARLRASWCFQAWSLSASKANSMAATRYDASPRREVCCCSRHSTRVALCALQLILVPSRGLTCGRGRYEMDGVNVRGPASILCSRVSKMELGGATTRS
jgi:hypothetical protein